MAYKISDDCVSCGSCVEACPVEAIFEGDGKLDTKIYDREKLSPGMEMNGPAIIEEVSASSLVYPGMKASIDVFGDIIIETEA